MAEMAESPRESTSGGFRARVGGQAGQPPAKRGRRRTPVSRLTATEAIRVDSQVRYVTRNSRSQKTLNTYSSYMVTIHDWYGMNNPELCTSDGKVDAVLIRRLCRTRDGLIEQAEIFKRCLMSKKHDKDKLANGQPAPARAVTLSGYRSAWAYYIWTNDVPPDELAGIPHDWDSTMKDYFKGLKNLEAERRQKGLLPSVEGKSKMTVNLLRHMTTYFHKEGDVVDSFNHIWSWNMICRSFNVSLLHAGSLGWAGDCISIEYGQDKTHRDGGRNKTGMIKHLYANPYEPEVHASHSCPSRRHISPPHRHISPPHISPPHHMSISSAPCLSSALICPPRSYVLRTHILANRFVF